MNTTDSLLEVADKLRDVMHDSELVEEYENRLVFAAKEITNLRQQVKELKYLLKMSMCPHCDNSGAIPVGENKFEQCQWCGERDQALANTGDKKVNIQQTSKPIRLLAGTPPTPLTKLE